MKIIKRYAIREDHSDYIKFIMEIPLDGILMNDETKSLYQEMMDVTVNNYKCLLSMAKMVNIIEDNNGKEEKLDFLK